MWKHWLPGFELCLLRELQQQQQNSSFCDTVLWADGVSVPAHSCVLAASSPHLSKVLSATKILNPAQHYLLQLKGVRAKVLLKLVGFLYTGKFQGEGKVEWEEVLLAARQIGIKGLIEADVAGRECRVDGEEQLKKKKRRREEDGELLGKPAWKSSFSEGEKSDIVGHNDDVQRRQKCGRGVVGLSNGTGREALSETVGQSRIPINTQTHMRTGQTAFKNIQKGTGIHINFQVPQLSPFSKSVSCKAAVHKSVALLHSALQNSTAVAVSQPDASTVMFSDAVTSTVSISPSEAFSMTRSDAVTPTLCISKPEDCAASFRDTIIMPSANNGSFFVLSKILRPLPFIDPNEPPMDPSNTMSLSQTPHQKYNYPGAALSTSVCIYPQPVRTPDKAFMRSYIHSLSSPLLPALVTNDPERGSWAGQGWGRTVCGPNKEIWRTAAGRWTISSAQQEFNGQDGEKLDGSRSERLGKRTSKTPMGRSDRQVEKAGVGDTATLDVVGQRGDTTGARIIDGKERGRRRSSSQRREQQFSIKKIRLRRQSQAEFWEIVNSKKEDVTMKERQRHHCQKVRAQQWSQQHVVAKIEVDQRSSNGTALNETRHPSSCLAPSPGQLHMLDPQQVPEHTSQKMNEVLIGLSTDPSFTEEMNVVHGSNLKCLPSNCPHYQPQKRHNCSAGFQCSSPGGQSCGSHGLVFQALTEPVQCTSQVFRSMTTCGAAVLNHGYVAHMIQNPPVSVFHKILSKGPIGPDVAMEMSPIDTTLSHNTYSANVCNIMCGQSCKSHSTCTAPHTPLEPQTRYTSNRFNDTNCTSPPKVLDEVKNLHSLFFKSSKHQSTHHNMQEYLHNSGEQKEVLHSGVAEENKDDISVLSDSLKCNAVILNSLCRRRMMDVPRSKMLRSTSPCDGIMTSCWGQQMVNYPCNGTDREKPVSTCLQTKYPERCGGYSLHKFSDFEHIGLFDMVAWEEMHLPKCLSPLQKEEEMTEQGWSEVKDHKGASCDKLPMSKPSTPTLSCAGDQGQASLLHLPPSKGVQFSSLCSVINGMHSAASTIMYTNSTLHNPSCISPLKTGPTSDTQETASTNKECLLQEERQDSNWSNKKSCEVNVNKRETVTKKEVKREKNEVKYVVTENSTMNKLKTDDYTRRHIKTTSFRKKDLQTKVVKSTQSAEGTGNSLKVVPGRLKKRIADKDVKEELHNVWNSSRRSFEIGSEEVSRKHPKVENWSNLTELSQCGAGSGKRKSSLSLPPSKRSSPLQGYQTRFFSNSERPAWPELTTSHSKLPFPTIQPEAQTSEDVQIHFVEQKSGITELGLGEKWRVKYTATKEELEGMRRENLEGQKRGARGGIRKCSLGERAMCVTGECEEVRRQSDCNMNNVFPRDGKHYEAIGTEEIETENDNTNGTDINRSNVPTKKEENRIEKWLTEYESAKQKQKHSNQVLDVVVMEDGHKDESLTAEVIECMTEAGEAVERVIEAEEETEFVTEAGEEAERFSETRGKAEHMTEAGMTNRLTKVIKMESSSGIVGTDDQLKSKEMEDEYEDDEVDIIGEPAPQEREIKYDCRGNVLKETDVLEDETVIVDERTCVDPREEITEKEVEVDVEMVDEEDGEVSLQGVDDHKMEKQAMSTFYHQVYTLDENKEVAMFADSGSNPCLISWPQRTLDVGSSARVSSEEDVEIDVIG